MNMMKRVLALLLVCAMLMPNLTTIASATELGEDPAAVSTEPVVVAEEPEETEATEAATEAPTEPATEATEAPAEETEAPTEQTEPLVEEMETSATEVPTESTEETVEPSAPEEDGAASDSLTVTVQQDAAMSQATEPVSGQASATAIPDFGEDFKNDFLFSVYVEDQFLDNLPATLGTAGRDRLPSEATKYIYGVLKPQIEKIAAGDIHSTVIEVEEPELSMQLSWSKDELGLDVLRSGGSFTQEAVNAIGKAVSGELDKIMNALLVDCPYDLYWYDKTVGVYSDFYFDSPDGNLVYISSMTVYMTVATGYQGSDEYTTTTALSRVDTAVANASAVVTQHRDKGDIEKLIAYAEYICEQVSYNDDVIKPSYSEGYGDPWQVIYVFDGSSSTNVVCEGYSKAFQYLFELSDFSGDLESYLIAGYAGGPHMWNVVSIDGRNYLMDVTNMDPDDTGAFGDDGSLFLAGASGSIQYGYTFANTYGGELYYTYYYDVLNAEGNKETIHPAVDVYGAGEDSILNLSDISYAEYL